MRGNLVEGQDERESRISWNSFTKLVVRFYRKILKTGERQLLFCYEEVFTVESSGFVW